jgi:eukaryotic-like serine/threonine-protein kinase
MMSICARVVRRLIGVPMDKQRDRAPEWTIEQSAPPAAESAVPVTVCAPRREVVHGSGPHLTNETQALLRYRLRAAALILFISFSVFLVRHVAGIIAGEPLDPLLLGAHVFVVLVLGACSLPLCRHRTVPLAKLRLAELIVFGLPAIFFLLLQHRVTLFDVARNYMPSPMPFWVLLIFTYAMFIPNTWRRAAVVIGGMALAPLLLVVGMVWVYPEVAALVTGIIFVQHSLTMLVAAVAAVFGTHLIHTLRREAFEARQLGQYRLIAPLGKGGMGEVFLAEHRMLKRPCAVKLIRTEQAGDPHVLARFEREVQMTARLSHWNTIEIFDYGRTDDGTFFYVMEYLPGLSLDELVQRHGPLPAERVIHLLRQTCHALREAHGVGLIHRDIKPGNLFAAQRGGQFDVAKILDFGLVKPIADVSETRLTRDGVISGTPLFMSPEQARGHDDIDARSDIYSLGAVAYALLTGRPPFAGKNPLDVVIAHIHDDLVSPSKYQSDVPGDLEQVIARCLAKRPEDRFPDVETLEQALSECAAADQWTQSYAAHWWRTHEPTNPRPTKSNAQAVTVTN